MITTQLSVGGLALALAILLFASVRTVVNGLRHGFRLPNIFVFAAGLLMGLLAALCTGGLLALATYGVTKGTNKVGDAVNGGGNHLLGPAAPAGLQAGGGFAVTVLLLLLIAMWICCDNALRRQIAWGGLVGASLGTVAGIAGLASATLIPWLNVVGDQYLTS